MRIMGLDLGSKRIGVAVSDAMLITAQGQKVITRSDREIGELAGLVQEFEVGEIVLGYPRNMNGTLGIRARMTEEYAQILRDRLNLPVRLWDERLSTVGAGRVLLEANLSRSKRKKVIDKMAAVFILQGYLDSRKAGPP